VSEKPKESPKCLIIMPISTPQHLAVLHNDPEHFRHVLDHLICPAVEQAGFTAVPPKSKGAALIHADIISKLQDAAMVLCDMSSLNANVFMELGVRTALDKPVCLVRDDKTPDIPFDTNSVNCHTYTSAMDPWLLQSSIPALSAHVRDSARSCAGRNPLWKYFGLTAAGTPPESGSTEERLSALLQQMNAIANSVDELGRLASHTEPGELWEDQRRKPLGAYNLAGFGRGSAGELALLEEVIRTSLGRYGSLKAVELSPDSGLRAVVMSKSGHDKVFPLVWESLAQNGFTGVVTVEITEPSGRVTDAFTTELGIAPQPSPRVQPITEAQRRLSRRNQ